MLYDFVVEVPNLTLIFWRLDLGQGLNTGLVDAGNYVAAVKKYFHAGQPLEQAMQLYDEEMRDRGLREVKMGNEQGKAVLDWTTLMKSEGVKKLIEMTKEFGKEAE
ncbi:MAG: hypothetical protein Q9227_007363 [Pyrenula ochraceoflavens]